MLLKMEKKSALHCFFIIFLHFSDVQAFIWKIYMLNLNIVGKDMVKQF